MPSTVFSQAAARATKRITAYLRLLNYPKRAEARQKWENEHVYKYMKYVPHSISLALGIAVAYQA